jgi:hypothetical protein
LTHRGLVIFVLAMASATGCTLRAVPVDPSSDGGNRHDAASDDGGTNTGIDASDAYVPPRECHALGPACTATTIVPSTASWVAYWTADHGVETEPRSAEGGGFERGVRRWRSLVGDASLVFPDEVASIFPDPSNPPMKAALYQVAGWGADFVSESCASGDCLPAVRLRRVAAATPTGQGDLLVSTDSSVLDAARSGSQLTVAMQIEIAPDPATRTLSLFSYGVASGNYPFVRGYISGTTFRVQSQDASGSPTVRIDYDGPIRRTSDSVVIFVIDTSAAEPMVLYRSDDGGPVTRSTATSAVSVAFPLASVDRFTIGALGRRTITDAFDGRVRRVAISREAFTIDQATALAEAWRDEDLALATSPAVRYANAIAPHAPVLFARLGESMPGGGMPFRAEVRESTQVAHAACETTFEVEAGRGGYIEIPDHDAYSIGTSGAGMTVEAWVRVDDRNPLGLPAGGGNESFVDWLGKGDALGELEWTLRLYRRDAAAHAGVLGVRTWGADGESAASADFIPMCELDEDRWAHVVAVADDPSAENAGVHLYVNGIPHHASVPYGTVAPQAGSAPLRIGVRSPPASSTPGGFFPGSVADVAIYPRALTAYEVLEHYQAGEGLRY